MQPPCTSQRSWRASKKKMKASTVDWTANNKWTIKTPDSWGQYVQQTLARSVIMLGSLSDGRLGGNGNNTMTDEASLIHRPSLERPNGNNTMTDEASLTHSPSLERPNGNNIMTDEASLTHRPSLERPNGNNTMTDEASLTHRQSWEAKWKQHNDW